MDEIERGRMRSELAGLRVEFALFKLGLALRAYNPDQPRVPAGNPDGGQWTDADGIRLASNVTRRPALGGAGGRWPGATPGQQSELAATHSLAQAAIRRVQERDPNWRPGSHIYETIDGAIAANNAMRLEAEARFLELQRNGIGSGPFAGESIPARGPERLFRNWERQEINRIGEETGCHTCGAFDPGTKSGNFVLDHQLPSARNPIGRPQRLFPQCSNCSSGQGLWIIRNRESR